MRIEPLANFPIERDLVVDLSHFIESLEAIKPYIIGNEAPALDGKPHPSKELQVSRTKQTPAQLENIVNSQCVSTVVYAMRLVHNLVLNPEFLGPAAITMAHRYNLDNRDHGKAQRMPLLNGKTVFGAVLSLVIVLKSVQNTWIQLQQSIKAKWKVPKIMLSQC